MDKIEIIFFLKDCVTSTISTTASMDDFCSKDKDGNYYYEIDGQKLQFKSVETLAKVLYEGMVDTLDRFHEVKINGGSISNEHIDTIFGFGNILVPIESVSAIKINILEDPSGNLNDVDKVIVEMEED